MSNGLKGLTLAAGIVITCLVIGIAFYVSRESRMIAAQGMNQMGAYAGEFADSVFSFYDGMIVSGKEVQTVIEKYRDQITVQVENNLKTVSIYTAETTLPNKKGLDQIINPQGKFLGQLLRNDNGLVERLCFYQQ